MTVEEILKFIDELPIEEVNKLYQALDKKHGTVSPAVRIAALEFEKAGLKPDVQKARKRSIVIAQGPGNFVMERTINGDKPCRIEVSMSGIKCCRYLWRCRTAVEALAYIKNFPNRMQEGIELAKSFGLEIGGGIEQNCFPVKFKNFQGICYLGNNNSDDNEFHVQMSMPPTGKQYQYERAFCFSLTIPKAFIANAGEIISLIPDPNHESLWMANDVQQPGAEVYLKFWSSGYHYFFIHTEKLLCGIGAWLPVPVPGKKLDGQHSYQAAFILWKPCTLEMQKRATEKVKDGRITRVEKA